MLALAIVVGCGCASLESQWKRFRWITVLIGALIFAEFLIIPIRLDSRAVNIPAYYTQLAERDGVFPILDVPVDIYGAQGPAAIYMLYQTVHQQPIVGGYISRTPTSAFAIFDYPFINQLRARLYNDQEPYIFTPETVATAKHDLDALRIYYVILHKDKLDEPDALQIYEVLQAVFTETEYEDEDIAVWCNH